MSEIVSGFELKMAIVAFIALALVNQVVVAAAGAEATNAAGFQSQDIGPQSPEAETLANPQDVNYSAPENESATYTDKPGDSGFMADQQDIIDGLLAELLPDSLVGFINYVANGFLSVIGWFQELLSGWGYLISIAGWAAPLVVLPQFALTLVMINPMVKFASFLSPV